jgi:hypothetical protein
VADITVGLPLLAAAIIIIIIIIIIYFMQLYKAGLIINLKHGICDSSVLNFCYCYWDINFLVRWQVPKTTSFCIFI